MLMNACRRSLVAFAGKGDTPDGISTALIVLAVDTLGAIRSDQTRDLWKECITAELERMGRERSVSNGALRARELSQTTAPGCPLHAVPRTQVLLASVLVVSAEILGSDLASSRSQAPSLPSCVRLNSGTGVEEACVTARKGDTQMAGKAIGEFSLKAITATYSPGPAGGVLNQVNWEGTATGFGAIFGTAMYVR